MNLYHLKWPDGATAAVMVQYEDDTIVTLTMMGVKNRLTDLADIKSQREFDARLAVLARTTGVQLTRRAI